MKGRETDKRGLLKRALSELLRKRHYHTASPVKKKEMLERVLRRLSWPEKQGGEGYDKD